MKNLNQIMDNIVNDQKHLSNAKNESFRRNERENEKHLDEHYDDLTDLFYECMSNYFPSTWNKYYGDADDHNEQWLLWKRFLARYEVRADEIEQLCDELVNQGERFAPNQGAIKKLLDTIRHQSGDIPQMRELYKNLLKLCYAAQYNPDIVFPNLPARKALIDSGGYGWHTEMHTRGQAERAFELWRDHYAFLLENGSEDYQAKIIDESHPPANAPVLRDTDKAMILLALKQQGDSEELKHFARTVGMSEAVYEKLKLAASQ